MGPAQGYRRARELLRSRFGNDYQISEAWVRKLTEGPQIKPSDGAALQDLSDDMQGCVETLKAMGKLYEIDSRGRMVKILYRLPVHIQSRWRKLAIDHLDYHGEYPGVEVLARFIESTAREYNDPVFGLGNSGDKKCYWIKWGSGTRRKENEELVSVLWHRVMPVQRNLTVKMPLLGLSSCSRESAISVMVAVY